MSRKVSGKGELWKLSFKYIKKVTAALLAAVLLLLCGSGCSEKDGSGYIFKYDIAANPVTLDPQTANDSSAYEIIANLFEGLLKVDNDGNIQGAAAESYDVSEDGLVYTFKLREDVYWYDGREFEAPCTAHDFVFAFQRLFKPATKSKTAGGFFCIKNAQAINSGSIAELSELGVEAVGDYDLVITLEYPNPSFPVLLTTAPAMPCNQEFYESTNGKYGLYANAVASNGAFYVHSWSYDPWSKDNNNIIMRANVKNNENERIYPYGLNFFIEEEDSYQNFLNEQSHVYITSGAEAVRLLDMGYEYSESSNKVWGVLFNVKSDAFRHEGLRQALAYSINRNSTETDATGYEKSNSLIPSSVKLGDDGYRELVGRDSYLTYSSLLAENALDSALPTMDKSNMTGLTLYVPDDDAIMDYVSSVAQQWQTGLNFYCNIKRLSAADYEKVLKSGEFDFIVADISGSFNSPYAYLSSFLSTGSGNYSGYVNSSFDVLMERAESAVTAEESAELFFEAEETVINGAVFIPLLGQSEYAFLGEDCRDIIYNPFSRTVVFREAKKF